MFRATALDHMNSTALAVLCGEISTSDCELPDQTRRDGIKLMREWNRLLQSAMPSPEQTHPLGSERRAIRQRMIDFLISI